jgi:CSLREA domain-containing protein
VFTSLLREDTMASLRFRIPSSSLSWSGILTTLLIGLSPPGLAGQTTFTVNTTNDADDGTCNAFHCSLREAITAANHTEGGALIAFNIPGSGPHTIRPKSALPDIEESITLDGTTEPDYSGTPVIELDGSEAGPNNGLNVVLSNNTIRGLTINRFESNGIQIHADAANNVIEGTFIGTDVTGSIALGNGIAGIMIGQAPDNTVGGTDPGSRNLISGNIEGVTIVDPAATNNVVLGNYIGTNSTGDEAIPNSVGVLVLAPGNTIGGTAAGAGNLISGNTTQGISLGPPYATGNLVVGNYIGVDASGTTALGNDIGVWVDNVADNTIGGTSEGARNVISGNREGITLWEAGATGNLIQGNYVGTNATGDAAIPNEIGIPVYSPGNTIGGAEVGAGNLISGNTSNGVNFYGENATANVVEGNLIGTDATGTSALGNGDSGVGVVFAAGNTIGGTESGAGNTLSGNVVAGVILFGTETKENLVLGNFIGTDPTGTFAVGNGDSGVATHDAASDNTIGGTEEGARNILSGNTFGILIGDFAATGNRIQGNYIGTNAAGDAAIPNTQTGILLWGQNTMIGGPEDGAGNVISGNLLAGIDLGPGSTGTIIQGNYIGTDATGSTVLGNDLGIWANFSPANTIGGTEPGAGNVISGNSGQNIQLNGLDAAGNTVQGNFIGTDATGTVALENGRAILIQDAPDNTIGGTEAGARNVISGNRPGISIEGATATGNIIQGNYIGVDVTGSGPLGNRGATIRFTTGASNNTVGGTEPGAGNIVANSAWVGIGLFPDAGTGNRILSNAIFDNSGMGIELNRDGVTLNDEGDADTGPNELQNYPEIQSAVSYGAGAVQATLNSTPNSTFTLDFFSNAECHETGFGEGRTPLGAASLSTDASGFGTVTKAVASITGSVVTATATDANGNTSEFSECLAVSTLGISSSPSTQTVTQGQPAVYAVSVTAQGGEFEETLDLSCTGNPAGTTCTFDQDQVTLVSGQASATMTVTTVAPAASAPLGTDGSPWGPPVAWLYPLLALAALLTYSTANRLTKANPAREVGGLGRPLVRGTLVAVLLLIPVSCGDDGTKPPTGGTPPGSYELTVSATWETVELTTTATMVVQ